MDNLSKMTLVKRHLETIKSKSVKLSGFAGHLSRKYSLDTLIESIPNPNTTKQEKTTVQLQVG